MKITFLGAGSTVFAKNVLGDCILTPELGEFEIALYDIDKERLEQSFKVIDGINKKYDGKATVTMHHGNPSSKVGDENNSPALRSALENADFIINAVQVGGYKPCTVTDFKIPKKYGLRQTIADTLGVGGIMRTLRTIPVLEYFAKVIEEVCPNAWFLNYTNPMAMLTGYLLKYTKVKAVGLCHSVQGCIPHLLRELNLDEKYNPADVIWQIYGINHQSWLLSAKMKDGTDIYPEIKERAKVAMKGLIGADKSTFGDRNIFVTGDRVRFRMMQIFGYYVTESSEHNAEYCPYFIKRGKPLLPYANKYRVPIDEYLRRCKRQIKGWKKQSQRLDSDPTFIEHTLSHEYGSQIIKAILTGVPFTFNGSALNTESYITNLPKETCVEIPIVADANGLTPQHCGTLPEQLAAYNMTNISPQLLALKANQTRKLKDLVMAVALDPLTAATLTLDKIEKMTIELYNKHYKDGWMPKYE